MNFTINLQHTVGFAEVKYKANLPYKFIYKTMKP